MLARYPFLAAAPGGRTADGCAQLAAQFLRHKEFHGANGCVITDAMALAIAAQAVLPVLNLGLAWYDDFVGIVVHPDEVVARRTVTDEARRGAPLRRSAGRRSHGRRPGDAELARRGQRAASTAEQGYNVVIHEFIHKIDMRDGAPDGCPPLPSRERARRPGSR